MIVYADIGTDMRHHLKFRPRFIHTKNPLTSEEISELYGTLLNPIHIVYQISSWHLPLLNPFLPGANDPKTDTINIQSQYPVHATLPTVIHPPSLNLFAKNCLEKKMRFES